MNDKFFVNELLKGHVALVTGGGTGITGGVARALAEAGARVVLVSRKMEHLEPAVEKIQSGGGEAFATEMLRPSIKSFMLFAQPQAAWADAWNVIVPLLQSGAIKPIVAKTFPLAEAADALRYLVEGRPFGRVVLSIAA